MRTPSLWIILLALGLLLVGCGSSDNGGGGSPSPTGTIPPTATRTSAPQPTPTAPPATSTHTPVPTPTSGQLDISICAPDAGPFSATIDNPFFPLPVGAQWILVGQSEEGLPVRVEVTSLDAPEVVAGIVTRVVREREWEDGALVEISHNFFVQTADGTVCYYGEDVDIYEAGEIVSHEGAWRAGVNAALPGIFMPANPQVGQVFQQEIAPGIAEDEATLVAAGETVAVDFGTFTDTIRFTELNPLDGGTSEKVYARGVGLIVDDPIERISASACGNLSGAGCAPLSERVDLEVPTFSNPTSVTNPLFPVSLQHSVILLGAVGGEPLRVEVTLLPVHKTIMVNGQAVETLESQFVAFLDGRIHEVALDWYGQADDGSVWYFGEDVFNYEDGVVADTGGTWLAGRDGPVAMIMPANPQVGGVYRTENIPGLVFEEVTVKSIGATVDGPTGPVSGAIVVEELHLDGVLEDKTFAPAYGEFSTGDGADLEALALAVPTDSLPGSPPAELDSLFNGADDIFDAALAGDWTAAEAALETMTSAWETYQAGTVPPMLQAQMNDALDSLAEEVEGRSPGGARQAAIDVARASLDFRLRHRPPSEIDRARFELWARQVGVDVADNDADAVRGDVTSLEWVWDRFKHTVTGPLASTIETLLGQLRTAADAENLPAARDAATQLRAALA